MNEFLRTRRQVPAARQPTPRTRMPCRIALLYKVHRAIGITPTATKFLEVPANRDLALVRHTTLDQLAAIPPKLSDAHKSRHCLLRDAPLLLILSRMVPKESERPSPPPLPTGHSAVSLPTSFLSSVRCGTRAVSYACRLANAKARWLRRQLR